MRTFKSVFLAPMSTDTFVVGIYFGHRIVSWPFGRLDITREQIGVRSWPIGRRSVMVPRTGVNAISVKKGRAVSSLKVEDVGAEFANVVVEMPFSVGRIICKCENYGYQITSGGR